MTKQAILVIDVQTTMFDGLDCPPIHNASTLVSNIKSVMEYARKASIPIAFIQHHEDEGSFKQGSPGWEVLDALGQDTATEPTFSKTVPNAFSNPQLSHWLDAANISSLILVGAQSDCCVDATTLSAIEHGYEVTVVSDAHSTWLWENDAPIDATPLILSQNEKFAKAGAQLITTQQLTCP
ncbi:isochorismatase hydrolase [Thraustotheca clavata]|uniref:Isochorismatase hydrolase n=1 Tax=Thraustotheca clavata TaxID=74557 RepID=A0A1W0AB05_9STRA|nr:isochorismatase hydrolase [Thraustotheca clavata]